MTDEEIFYTKLGRELCGLRCRRNITVHDAASMSGIPARSYRAIERGAEIVAVHDFMRILDALRIR